MGSTEDYLFHVEMKFSVRALAATLITAVEQGIHYWARNVGAEEEISQAATEAAVELGLPAYCLAPIRAPTEAAVELGLPAYCLAPIESCAPDLFGFTLDEYDDTVPPDDEDDSVGTLERHWLNGQKIRRGLQLLLENNPTIFGQVVSGEADAYQADLFVQYCLFGEERYA